MSTGDRITFGHWLASRPFGRLPSEAEALRLELAWNTALRCGRESTPPGPGPAVADTVTVSREDLQTVFTYARQFDVDDDPAMVRVAAGLGIQLRP